MKRCCSVTTTFAMINSTPSSCIKYLVLILVVFQTSLTVIGIIHHFLTIFNTFNNLVMRYTRKNDNGHPYITTTFVFNSEILKYLICCIIFYHQCDYSCSTFIKTFRQEILHNQRETLKLSVPACLYTLQGNLLIVSLTNLDAATFQVTYQLKILTTAVFSVIILEKILKLRQWFSLVLLFVGVSLLQLGQNYSSESEKENKMIGFITVGLGALSSG